MTRLRRAAVWVAPLALLAWACGRTVGAVLLVLAVANDKFAATHALLQLGADPNAPPPFWVCGLLELPNDGLTPRVRPLGFAVSGAEYLGRGTRMVTELVRAGGDPWADGTAADASGIGWIEELGPSGEAGRIRLWSALRTARCPPGPVYLALSLHRCVVLDSLPAIQYWLAAGARPYVLDTALGDAVSRGDRAGVRQLLGAGHMPDAVVAEAGGRPVTAFDQAMRSGGVGNGIADDIVFAMRWRLDKPTGTIRWPSAATPPGGRRK